MPLSDIQNSVLKSHSIIPSKLFTEWKIWWTTNGCPWKRKECNIWSAVCNPRSTTNSCCNWGLVKVKSRGESCSIVSRSASRCDVCKETQPEIFALPCLRSRYTHDTESLQEGDCMKDRGSLRNSPALEKLRKFCVLLQSSGHTACGVFAVSALASPLLAAVPWTAELLWHTNTSGGCMVLPVQLSSWHMDSNKPGCNYCFSCRFAMDREEFSHKYSIP